MHDACYLREAMTRHKRTQSGLLCKGLKISVWSNPPFSRIVVSPRGVNSRICIRQRRYTIVSGLDWGELVSFY
jgi:hypothetical protein